PHGRRRRPERGGRPRAPAGGSRQGLPEQRRRSRPRAAVQLRRSLRIAVRRATGGWEVWVDAGRTPTGLDAVAWADEATVRRGAGEVLLTSMDRDGTGDGYDLELLAAVTRAVPVPVVASGGAGTLDDFALAILQGGADAVLAASRLHSGALSIRKVKDHLAGLGIPVRR